MHGADGSPRLVLAHLAGGVVAQASGVVGTDPERRWTTVVDGREIRGVTAIAASGGRFDVDLHILATWPPEPLRRLADDLRREIGAGAEREGLADRLGAVNVHVEGIVDPAGDELAGTA